MYKKHLLVVSCLGLDENNSETFCGDAVVQSGS